MELLKPYAFGRCIALEFADAEQRVREELQKEGFGVLTEINVKEKFREKLGLEFRNYVILGACNPSMAWEAFGKEIDIGTLLPCNVCVYQSEDGHTVVMAMDPVAALSLIGNPALTELAKQVKKKLQQVLMEL